MSIGVAQGRPSDRLSVTSPLRPPSANGRGACRSGHPVVRRLRHAWPDAPCGTHEGDRSGSDGDACQCPLPAELATRAASPAWTCSRPAAARYPCSRPGVPRGDWHPARTGRMPDMVRLPTQDQKSMLACGSVVAVQNSVTLPSRTWATLATGISIDLFPREADSVHSVTACSSLASTS